jgi:hypothetical protein
MCAQASAQSSTVPAICVLKPFVRESRAFAHGRSRPTKVERGWQGHCNTLPRTRKPRMQRKRQDRRSTPMKNNLFAMIFSVTAAFALVACVQENVDGLEGAEEMEASESENVGAAESALTTRTGFTCAAGYSLALEANFLTCKKIINTVVNSPTPVDTDVTHPRCGTGTALPKPKLGMIDDCGYGSTSNCPPVSCPAGVTNCAQPVYVIDGYSSGGYDSCVTDVYYSIVTTTDYQQPILQ